MRMIRISSFLVLVILMFPVSALAEWRSDIGVFRIGVVTGDKTTGFVRRAEPFRRALSDALGMDVEFFTAKRPEAIIDALTSARIEYAIISATGYALTWSVCECVEPIVSPRSADGTDGYNLVLLTRSNGPKDLENLRGKQIGVLSSSRSAEAGILRLAFKEAGLTENDIELINRESGEATLTEFLDGQFEALLGWSSMTGNPSIGYTRGTLQVIARRTDDLATKFPIIWKSEQLPHRVHLVRKKLPGEAKNILRNLLASLFDRNPVAYDSIEPIYGGGFTIARHSQYQPFIDVVKAFGEVNKDVLDTELEAGGLEITPEDTSQ